MECTECSDSERIAMFTAAIEFGASNYLDFENFSAALVNRGTLYLNIEENQKAIDDFEFAISLDSGSGNLDRKLGTAYLQSGDYHSAIAHYDKYIDQWETTNTAPPEPDEVSDHQLAIAYNNRAIAKGHLRDRDGACADFRQALRHGMIQLEEFIKELCD